MTMTTNIQDRLSALRSLRREERTAASFGASIGTLFLFIAAIFLADAIDGNPLLFLPFAIFTFSGTVCVVRAAVCLAAAWTYTRSINIQLEDVDS